MVDAINMLDASSSNIALSTCFDRRDEVELGLHSQLSRLYSAPRFTAMEVTGADVSAREWGDEARLAYDAAIAYLLEFPGNHRDQHRLIAGRLRSAAAYASTIAAR